MTSEHIKNCVNKSVPELQLWNPFDRITQAYLKVTLNEETYQQIAIELQEFGYICINKLNQWGVDAEQNPPLLVKQDVYGRVVDELRLSEGWKRQKQYAVELDIVKYGYENNLQQSEFTRLIQMIRLTMYQPNSGLYGCPLAMTDGAAYLLTNWLSSPTTKDNETIEFVAEACKKFKTAEWTSGQWMTEKDGGSDVSNATQTIAIPEVGNRYKLYGYKWFSSATDADVAITLARIGDLSKPLSLFILRVKDQKTQKLNNITIKALKEKLGTRQLPTAELLLDGTEAYLISEPGKGVKGISAMLNVTRMYNASSAIGSMRRMYQLVLDYSYKRKAFGKLLIDLPAHRTLLTKFDLNVRANTLFLYKLAYLWQGNEENKSLFRLMVPLLKMYTAKQAVKWMSEGIEALGALGYMENSNVPVLLRDAQVLTIWEGTTNVLSLDFLRALKGQDMLNIYAKYHNGVFLDLIAAEIRRQDSLALGLAKLVNNHNGVITKFSGPIVDEKEVRFLGEIVSESFIALQFLEMIMKSGRNEDIISFQLWMEQAQTFVSDQLIHDKNIQNEFLKYEKSKL